MGVKSEREDVTNDAVHWSPLTVNNEADLVESVIERDYLSYSRFVTLIQNEQVLKQLQIEHKSRIKNISQV